MQMCRTRVPNMQDTLRRIRCAIATMERFELENVTVLHNVSSASIDAALTASSEVLQYLSDRAHAVHEHTAAALRSLPLRMDDVVQHMDADIAACNTWAAMLRRGFPCAMATVTPTAEFGFPCVMATVTSPTVDVSRMHALRTLEYVLEPEHLVVVHHAPTRYVPYNNTLFVQTDCLWLDAADFVVRGDIDAYAVTYIGDGLYQITFDITPVHCSASRNVYVRVCLPNSTPLFGHEVEVQVWKEECMRRMDTVLNLSSVAAAFGKQSAPCAVSKNQLFLQFHLSCRVNAATPLMELLCIMPNNNGVFRELVQASCRTVTRAAYPQEAFRTEDNRVLFLYGARAYVMSLHDGAVRVFPPTNVTHFLLLHDDSVVLVFGVQIAIYNSQTLERMCQHTLNCVHVMSVVTGESLVMCHVMLHNYAHALLQFRHSRRDYNDALGVEQVAVFQGTYDRILWVCFRKHLLATRMVCPGVYELVKFCYGSGTDTEVRQACEQSVCDAPPFLSGWYVSDIRSANYVLHRGTSPVIEGVEM